MLASSQNLIPLSVVFSFLCLLRQSIDNPAVASRYISYQKSHHLELNKERGYVDRTGKIIFNAADADLLDWRFHEGLLLVRNLEGTYEFWDKKGHLACPQKFEDALWFQEGLCPVRHDGKWGFINRSGEMVITPQFDLARPFCGGLARVKLNDMWGYILTSGKITIEPQFHYCLDFSEGLGAASKNGLVGYINKRGRFVIEPTYNQCTPFSCGVAGVTSIEGEPKTRHRMFIDHHGKLVFDYDKMVKRLSPSYKPFTDDFKVYNYNEITSGQRKTPVWGNHLNDYYEVQPAELQFSEGLLPMPLGDCKSVYLKNNGHVAFSVDAQYVGHFNEGLAVVTTGDTSKWTYLVINRHGRCAISKTFEYIGGFSEGLGFFSYGADVVRTKYIIDKHGRLMGTVATSLLCGFYDGVSRMGDGTPFPKHDVKPKPEYNCIPLKTLQPSGFGALDKRFVFF